MMDSIEVEITKSKQGSANIVLLDTEYRLRSCHLTKKYEAKIVTDSGVTQITEPLIDDGNYISMIIPHTMYSYRIIFVKASMREDIILGR